MRRLLKVSWDGEKMVVKYEDEFHLPHTIEDKLNEPSEIFQTHFQSLAQDGLRESNLKLSGGGSIEVRHLTLNPTEEDDLNYQISVTLKPVKGGGVSFTSPPRSYMGAGAKTKERIDEVVSDVDRWVDGMRRAKHLFKQGNLFTSPSTNGESHEEDEVPAEDEVLADS